MTTRSNSIHFNMELTDAKSCIYAAAHPAQLPAEKEEEEIPTVAVKTEAKVKNGKCHPSDTRLFVPPCKLAFVYGTLKRGFGNYWLMEELMAKGHAHFVGVARTKKRFPLVCGPFQVPFLLNMPASGHHVKGEVYQVDQTAIARLDELEGVSKGHYLRCPVALTALELHSALQPDLALDPACLRSMDVLAEAYFAASGYTPGLARSPYIECFTEKEASTYVRRKDRPQHRTFLEHVSAWIEERDNV